MKGSSKLLCTNWRRAAHSIAFVLLVTNLTRPAARHSILKAVVGSVLDGLCSSARLAPCQGRWPSPPLRSSGGTEQWCQQRRKQQQRRRWQGFCKIFIVFLSRKQIRQLWRIYFVLGCGLRHLPELCNAPILNLLPNQTFPYFFFFFFFVSFSPFLFVAENE